MEKQNEPLRVSLKFSVFKGPGSVVLLPVHHTMKAYGESRGRAPLVLNRSPSFLISSIKSVFLWSQRTLIRIAVVHYLKWTEANPVKIHEGYSESNLRWANKGKKKRLYTKYAYILKILLNVVTIATDTLIISGNKFVYACVREVCRLWAQPRFLIRYTNSLLLKSCDHSQFFS
jgi:hypothetical protein